MKKIFLILSFIFFNVATYAVDHIAYEIKLKGQQKPIIVYDANIEKTDCTYTDKITNQKTTIKYENVEFIRKIDVGGFNKVIILTNKRYFEGVIIYQDRKTISIQVDGQLSSFDNKEVTNIVSEQDFKEEQNRGHFKAAGLSMLFPGAGQMYEERYGAGALYGAVFLSSMSGAFFSYYNAQNSWKAYKDSSYVNKNKYTHESQPNDFKTFHIFFIARSFFFNFIFIIRTIFALC